MQLRAKCEKHAANAKRENVNAVKSAGNHAGNHAKCQVTKSLFLMQIWHFCMHGCNNQSDWLELLAR